MKTPNGLDSLFLTNDVQTDPTTNTLESSDVCTEQNTNESFLTSKATQNTPFFSIDIKLHIHTTSLTNLILSKLYSKLTLKSLF